MSVLHFPRPSAQISQEELADLRLQSRAVRKLITEIVNWRDAIEQRIRKGVPVEPGELYFDTEEHTVLRHRCHGDHNAETRDAMHTLKNRANPSMQLGK